MHILNLILRKWTTMNYGLMGKVLIQIGGIVLS